MTFGPTLQKIFASRLKQKRVAYLTSQAEPRENSHLYKIRFKAIDRLTETHGHLFEDWEVRVSHRPDK
jgi:hypothetical protein